MGCDMDIKISNFSWRVVNYITGDNGVVTIKPYSDDFLPEKGVLCREISFSLNGHIFRKMHDITSEYMEYVVNGAIAPREGKLVCDIGKSVMFSFLFNKKTGEVSDVDDSHKLPPIPFDGLLTEYYKNQNKPKEV